MAEARQRAEWARTAEVLCLLANVNRDPRKRSRPFQSHEFNPYRRKPPDVRIKADFLTLKTVFVDNYRNN